MKLIILFTILFFSIIFFRGAYLNALLVNTDALYTDQQAYLDGANWMKQYGAESFYDFPRNRMPIYPSFLTLVYDKDPSRFFLKAKLLNIGLSYLYLMALLLVLKKYLPPLSLINTLLIIVFTVFIYRSPYVGAETTYYFLFFISFLLLLNLIASPTKKLSVAAGVISGLTQLTKAGAFPLVIIFLIVYTVKYFVTPAGQLKTKLLPLFNTLIFVLSFLVVVGPYLYRSKVRFGEYLYNVNSTFYLWYDSWHEAVLGTSSYGDDYQYPNLPPDMIPSLGKYFLEHSLRQSLTRVIDGGDTTISVMTGKYPRLSYGYYKYVAIYALIFCYTLLLHWSRVTKIAKKRTFEIIFSVIVIVSYSLLTFWYAAIATGNRFILVLFMPTLFLLSFTIHKLNNLPKLKIRKHRFAINNVLEFIVFIVLIGDIYFTSVSKIFLVIGGE